MLLSNQNITPSVGATWINHAKGCCWVLLMILLSHQAYGLGWTPLTNSPVGSVGLGHMILLSDGTVMAENSNNIERNVSDITISATNPCVVTWVGHSLAENTLITFATTGALPSPLSALHYYLVKNTTVNTFQLSQDYSAALLRIDTAGSIQNGSHTATVYPQVTFTIADEMVVSWPGHGFPANTQVAFFGVTPGAALPGNLVSHQAYFVLAKDLGLNSFKISATQGGPPISSTGTIQTQYLHGYPLIHEGPEWYRLTPDSSGNYVNGTWSNLSPMAAPRIHFASQVLTDGRVLVAGGEQPVGAAGGRAAEIFDPTTNAWTATPDPTTAFSVATTGGGDSSQYNGLNLGSVVLFFSQQNSNPFPKGSTVKVEGASPEAFIGTWPVTEGYNNYIVITCPATGAITTNGTITNNAPQNVSDANSVMLPDGRVMVAVVDGTVQSTRIYTPVAGGAGTWADGPTCKGIHNETAWVKLPDDSILFADSGLNDPNPRTTERYRPDLNNQWTVDTALGTNITLYDTRKEIGPGFLLPNGRVIFFGATGETAIYDPNDSTWRAGGKMGAVRHSDLNRTIAMAQVGMPDAPAVLMPNGRILCLVS